MRVRFIINSSVFLALLSLFTTGGGFLAHAQASFEGAMRAAGANVLKNGTDQIYLWGVEKTGAATPALEIRALTTLDDLVGKYPVRCTPRQEQSNPLPTAQCINYAEIDLALAMLQNGFVIADRSAVYGTVFEDAYIRAEQDARNKNLGIWHEESASGSVFDTGQGSWMVFTGLALFLGLVGVFTFLSVNINRSFRNIASAQNESFKLASRERVLRDKEREIIAVMLDSELKSNKAKIEAFIAVYEETLSAMQDPVRSQRHRASTQTVQRQPALSRSIFDRNTDRIDLLGRKLASRLVHFYARIKSRPDYADIPPDMPQDEAIRLVDSILAQATKLNQLADELLQELEVSGVLEEGPEERV